MRSHRSLVLASATCLAMVLLTVLLLQPSDRLRELSGGGRAERERVFFLKIHKAGSSTVQNVLMRYALDRGLDLALPSKNNYVGGSDGSRFAKSHLGEGLVPPDGKFDMFVHHTRFSHEIPEVLREGALWVTIVREPVALYESLYVYYNLTRKFGLGLRAALRSDPDRLAAERLQNHIGVEQMAWDLGLDPGPRTSLPDLLDRLDSFDLVLLAEQMDASLVLLAGALGWPLSRFAYLPLNARTPDRKTKLTESERAAIAGLNPLDARIYRRAEERFARAVEEFGVEKLRAGVEELDRLCRELRTRCVEGVAGGKGYAHTDAYRLVSGAPPECRFAAKQELLFTEELRALQRERLAKARRLETFLRGHRLLPSPDPLE